VPQSLLPPEDAARLAQMVYGGLRRDNAAEVIARYGNGMNRRFAPVSGTIEGETGAWIKRTSNFAMVLDRAGQHAGEKVVAIRGTEFSSGRDWLSNFNAGHDCGPGGWLVHAGFNRVYKSIVREIKAALNAGGTPGAVHVVGHSLGGAIAAITALDLQRSGNTVALYTYGAPRPGMSEFSTRITGEMPGRIFRVYNIADPVPMVPIFPFLHAPYPGDGIRIGGSTGSISASMHDMTRYVDLSKGLTWTNLIRQGRTYEVQRGVEYWLNEAGRNTSIPGGAMAYWALGKALSLIIKAIGGSIMATVSDAITAVDLIASLMLKAVQVAGKISEWVVSWIRTALRWAGRTVADSAGKITRAFLVFVLQLVFGPLSLAARQAIAALRGIG